MRECGLKDDPVVVSEERGKVTPLAGVWIEREQLAELKIEPGSLPLRECGLKASRAVMLLENPCHSPCGSVD